MGKDKFVKDILGLVNDSKKAVTVEGVIDAECQTGDEERQYDQLFERTEKLCVELQHTKDQIEQMRDIISTCTQNAEEEKSIWIGCFEC